MIEQIVQSLYADSTDELLYHYTTIKGLQGIVSAQCLWASDVRYMNDSAELNYIVELLQQRVKILQVPQTAELLNHFVDWTSNRITNGHMVFAASFRANGNLLSQWRGYSSVGKGVSLGFKAKDIQQFAKRSGFKLGRCVYQHERQIAIIDQVLNVLSKAALKEKIQIENSEDFFQSIEADLLYMAALFKHPSFAEEAEWRIVSPAVTDYLTSPVNFREGVSMLIPYYEFTLVNKEKIIPIFHLFLGPTPNRLLSLNSLKLYLEKHSITPPKGIDYCDIPYRNR